MNEKITAAKREQFCSNAQKSISDFGGIFYSEQKTAVGVQGVFPYEMPYCSAKPNNMAIEYSVID